MPKTFIIRGPYKVPFDSRPRGRVIRPEDARQFWEECADETLENGLGCYVFAHRAGPGFTPIYVGKTAKSFKQEAFNPPNLGLYTAELANYKRGTPVMFFVTPDWGARAKTKSTEKLVGELEKFLIELAASANPDLANVHGARRGWGIKGVHRGHGGQGGEPGTDFRRMLSLAGLLGLARR